MTNKSIRKRDRKPLKSMGGHPVIYAPIESGTIVQGITIKAPRKKSGMELGMEWLAEQLGRPVTEREVFRAAMSLRRDGDAPKEEK